MPFVGRLDGELVSLNGLPARDTVLRRDYPTIKVPVTISGVKCVSCGDAMYVVEARYFRHWPGRGSAIDEQETA